MTSKNQFYNDFDFERLKESNRTGEYRTFFQIDRDRIIHSSEFRRLQGKTQVFLPGEYDFYRTRLTHSIEVAQIGRAICYFLNTKAITVFNEEYYLDSDLIEAACLAHDLGHPPFGHGGERILNSLMRKYGGFEGNAQTLRLLSETFFRDEGRQRGMNPTRASLDSILKYKVLYSESSTKENHFLYDYQKKYLDFVFNNLNYSDYIKTEKELNSFRSIECQIMDFADDTAYAINDLIDSIMGGFITYSKLIRWGNANEENLSLKQEKILSELADWIKLDTYKKKLSALVGNFIQGCQIKERETFLDNYTNRYKYILYIDNAIKDKLELFKKLSVDIVFNTSQLHQMEYKANHLIKRLFEAFEQNYIVENKGMKLLPEFNDRLIKNQIEVIDKSRIMCDYIAGMTDGFALRNYKRLFQPDYSSFVDLI
ncbi:MAG: dNTP triphosphohydrolase [bacterium]